ncbi:MAG: hypothetical protein U0736_04915 [Gemmataceae bacterium]
MIAPLPSAWRLVVVALLLARRRGAQAGHRAVRQRPVTAGFPTFTPDLLPILNDPSRVYWYEVNGDASFFYKGDARTLNAMLRLLAKGGMGRELVLHAGPLKRTSLDGARPVDASWHVHVPGGIGLILYADGELVTDKAPTLHLYLNEPRQPLRVPSAQVARWIAELDSDEKAVRERASEELAKQGAAVLPALRTAVDTTASAEVRRRVSALLARLPGLSLDLLTIPEGLTVIGPDELVERCTRGRRSKEYVIRGIAASRLADLEPDRTKAVAGLLRVLKEDDNEYVRRSVAGTLHREGYAARAALPELRKVLDDADVNVRNAFRAAVAAIEKTREEPDADRRTRAQLAVQADIRAYLKDRTARKR